MHLNRAQESHNETPSVLPRKICFNWEKGYCRRGSKCPYMHVKETSVHFNAASVRPNNRRLSTRLLIEKIPQDSCNITSIHEHFNRFGVITNIDLMPDQFKAKIQFSTHEQANDAYTCPDVIFGNRFVKLSWDDGSSSKPQQPLSNIVRGKSVQKLVREPHLLISNTDSIILTKKQAMLKTMLELQQRQQELLDKRIQEQKILLQRLEYANEKDKVEMKKEPSSTESVTQTISQTHSYNQQHKPILRGPVRMNREQQAKSAYGAYTLDLRPKTLRMTPIPATVGTDPLNLRRLFEPYGQVADLTVDEISSSVSCTFARRSDAEKALRHLQETNLQEGLIITWK